jgi:hypothetical protein
MLREDWALPKIPVRRMGEFFSLERRWGPATSVHQFDPHPPRIRSAHDASASPSGRGRLGRRARTKRRAMGSRAARIQGAVYSRGEPDMAKDAAMYSSEQKWAIGTSPILM